jgi:hypothetical protein
MIINITYITKSYIYHKINIEVLIGFEPMNKSFADSPLKPLGYSTNLVYFYSYIDTISTNFGIILNHLVVPEGFEPSLIGP